MEKREFQEINKLHIVFIVALILLTVTGIATLIIRISNKNSICLNCISSGLIVCMLLFLVFIIWTYSIRIRQMLEYDYLQQESEMKCEYEREQAQLNHKFRLEALKLEKLHQIVKEITQKKEDETIPKIKETTLSLNVKMVDEIRTLINEFEKL